MSYPTERSTKLVSCHLRLVALALASLVAVAILPQANAQVTLLNRVLRNTDFQTEQNNITASCSVLNCSAPPRLIFPILPAVCPGPINQTCTFYIHLESQATLSANDRGLFQFLVDGVRPFPGPTDPAGLFTWDNNDPDSAMAAPFSHSYAVTAEVTNMAANQVHPITVSVSCVDFNSNAFCGVTTGLSNLEVQIYTP